MPNPVFCSFVSNFWHSILCKKIEFGTTYSILVEKCLKILIEDGFIKNFFFKNHVLFIEGVSLEVWLKYNWIILYSTTWKIRVVTYAELLTLSNTGGYFLLTTPYGVLNDSDAWRFKTGGVLLMGIF